MKHPTSYHDLVAIVWRDSSTQHGWKNPATQGEVGTIVSVGFIRESNADQVTIVPGLAAYHDEQVSLDSPTTIPREAVVSISKMVLPGRAQRAADRHVKYRTPKARRKKA